LEKVFQRVSFDALPELGFEECLPMRDTMVLRLGYENTGILRVKRTGWKRDVFFSLMNF
jgi:hypothetical protein